MLAAFGIAATATQAQTATQGFETPATAYNYSAKGTGRIFTVASDGAAYAATGTSSYGVANTVNAGGGSTTTTITTINFTHVKFKTGSNTLTFRTAAVKENPPGGLDANGSIAVNIAYNRTANYIPTLKISGSNSNPAWGFAAAGTTTVNVLTANPGLTSVTATNAGPALVTINFGSTITDVDVQIELTSTGKTDLLIDDVATNNYAALPVELISFEAVAKASGVNLAWATASEKNSDRFEIQRSATGEAYETLGLVKGQGSTTTAHSYSFVDSRPLAGTSYYRLRQVDTDGTSSFSPVAAVQAEASTKVELYPNPSANQLILPAGVGAVRYRIFNALGQTLLSGKATDNDRLDITSLPKGPFFLELSGATAYRTQRLMRE
ncbi:MAG: hypothetical protein JWP58_1765 [Hymenobacter sp.]|nr:hypothetical protein [Hymenobacter sp.]